MKEVKHGSFTTNYESFLTDENEVDFIQFERDDKYKSNEFNIVVHRKKAKCQDTGNNPITIDFEGHKLELNNLKNVQIFEFDSNNDGKNELYIISYESCDGLVQILRIKKPVANTM